MSSLERPCRADRQSVRVAELGTDALVLGSKRHTPDFGLHTDAVGEPVMSLFFAGKIPRAVLVSGTWLPDESGDVRLQPCDPGLAEDIDERYRQRPVNHAAQ